MLPNKITKNFKEISKFFVENFDNSASAIFTVLDMLKLSDKSLCFQPITMQNTVRLLNSY